MENENNDFLMDGEILEYDEFFGGKKWKNKNKNLIRKILKKNPNLSPQRMPTKMKELLFKPKASNTATRGCLNKLRNRRMTKVGKIRFLQNCMGEVNYAMYEQKTPKQDTRVPTAIKSPRKPKSTLEECKKRASRVRFKRKKGSPDPKIAFIQRCMGGRIIKKGWGIKVGIPPSVQAGVKEVIEKDERGVPLSKSEVELVESVSTPTIEEVTPKKKPPYVLYGAVGLIGVIVLIRMFK